MLKSVMEKRFTKPKNWQWGSFSRDEGQSDKTKHHIRYGFCKAANPKSIAIIAPGRSEPAELYFETIHDLLNRNFSVAVIDWQGQGGSYRLNDDNSRHHSTGFESDAQDFEQFLDHINDTFAPMPKCLIAHSMGGHFGLKFMKDNPAYFDCAVMIAPMFGIHLPLFIGPLATIISETMPSQSHMPGMQAWTPEFHEEKVKHLITSDPARGDLLPQYYAQNPILECGGVTCGWFSHASRSNRDLASTDFSNLETPILLAVAGDEQVVDNNAIYAMAKKIPDVELHEFEHSQHGIHLETDVIRNALWQEIDRFTQKHLHLKPKA